MPGASSRADPTGGFVWAPGDVGRSPRWPDKGKVSRTLEVTRVARRGNLLRVLREVGVVGDKPATREGAVRFREALEELGTSFVKLGQLLSSRPDLLPDVYIEELDRLVDDAPPLPFGPMREVIDREIGLEHFASIDETPLAAASIAQIHAALLTSGRRGRRQGAPARASSSRSSSISSCCARRRRSPRTAPTPARLLQLNALTEELEQHLLGELDFLEEAHNAELISAVIAEYARRPLRPGGDPPVRDRAGARAGAGRGRGGRPRARPPGERAAELARTFFRAYIRQVTVKGVYHADPHRGNVLLTPDGRLALLDFGLIGRLDDDTRASLALLLLAIAQNRADDVADLILSHVADDAASDESGFVHDLRRKLPRYQWRPLAGIRTGEALADLQRLCLQHGIALPTSFALVGKTLSQAESIARTLDPSLDPVELIRREGWIVMAQEAERRLEPNQLLAFGSRSCSRC